VRVSIGFPFGAILHLGTIPTMKKTTFPGKRFLNNPDARGLSPGVYVWLVLEEVLEVLPVRKERKGEVNRLTLVSLLQY
jgi:hypothetical protein